jgi:hypothetical protein
MPKNEGNEKLPDATKCMEVVMRIMEGHDEHLEQTNERVFRKEFLDQADV